MDNQKIQKNTKNSGKKVKNSGGLDITPKKIEFTQGYINLNLRRENFQKCGSHPIDIHGCDVNIY